VIRAIQIPTPMLPGHALDMKALLTARTEHNP
jgi:hypothetical protein